MYYEEFVLTKVEAVFDDHELGDAGPWCNNYSHEWLCTRSPHEDDMHEALDSTGWVCARWGLDESL